MSGRDRENIELALDRCVCYPMEAVKLYIRVRLETPKQSLLCIHLPKNVEVERVHMENVDDNYLHVYSYDYDGRLLAVQLAKYLQPGGSSEIEISMRLHSIPMNHYLSFCAWMDPEIPERKGTFFTEPEESRSINLTVKASAEYMRYLPELYSYDDFMNRFMMLFESFWKPVNQQISQIENYFDPDLTPESFLTWLASWVGMSIDETFPKDRIRLLIRNAIPFHHGRGTANSLKLFLELYSGGHVEIRERKAQNMLLGGTMGLGDGLALGKENKPNTVIVEMQVSPSELDRTGFTKEKYALKIKELIRTIVPAHTVFTLSCKFE